MTVAVWANAPGVPALVCEDARLTNRDEINWLWSDRPTTTTDQIYGQAGWDIGVNFNSFASFADQLFHLKVPIATGKAAARELARGEIGRLAIHAHGFRGEILVNGPSGSPLTAATVRQMHPTLHKIGLMTRDDPKDPATIMFAGCLAGSGPDGSKLLMALSRVWPHRKVVGFASLGYAAAGVMKRSGEACAEPGMRDTGEQFPGEADKSAGKHWNDLRAWPWASGSSKTAKVAFNGSIIFGAQW